MSAAHIWNSCSGMELLNLDAGLGLQARGEQI
jgi:hypothetical protein